ncbi:hypothetical protein [Arcanobacterium pinnipediorum]|uniref:Uncharacterized protein n=1 Tax=Arcanobacterium pinnipediorum TaxID=1503041 RepID=A0ABY5AI49_9ACTO|nr:hypothetical protein [Arcanobacterium pinnipediorum]USR79880.1 hypothetical protein NG665_02540 [Arcanobacterium pinnipediorum]
MTALLERLTNIADKLGLPFEVGLCATTPAPQTYLVATPLADTFEVFADNQPGLEVEEVRLALFTRGNYLDLRNRITRALLDAGLTITGRTYVGFENDTGFHHYAIDVATHHTYR